MIAKNLVKRIRKEYCPFDFNNWYNDKNWDKIHKRDEYVINQDFEYLGLMLRKHLTRWWD